MASRRFTCPCCGWPHLRERPYERWPDGLPVDVVPPYEDAFGAPSYEVCLCCGFEFGNDDKPGTAEGDSFEGYRWTWVRNGTVWFDAAQRPDDWSLDRQLAAAHIDALRPDVPRLGKMSGADFVRALADECPKARPLIDEHRQDHDAVLLHLLVAELRRFAIAAFERSDTEIVNCCLEVVTRALTEGNDYVSNAIAVSFVEDAGLWDPATAGFIASWPASMRIEAEHQRQWDTTPGLAKERRHGVGRDDRGGLQQP